MRQFVVAASIIGGVSSFLGFWLAYAWDWPVGPTDVVLLGAIYAFAWLVKSTTTLFTGKK
jgi:ABC-type Mn2+/Zn2+ transport system permease subunit